MAHQHS